MHCVTSVYCRPQRWCSQSAVANGLKELEYERRGGRGGWAEGRGNLITETPVWTFPPPPTLSGRIGEGSLPPPGRRGAEPGSGEETLSARVVVARAGALTWRRLSTSGAGLLAQAGSRPGVSRARRRVRCPPPTLPVLLRGYCYPSERRGQEDGRRVLLRRRPPCPDARLSAGWGGGSYPLGS